MPSEQPANLDLGRQRLLGRTGLAVGRLGVGSSYGAPASAFEQAFEHGVNYFYWGTLRRRGMRDAIRAIASRHREQLVVVVQSYARLGFCVTLSLERALRSLRLDHADVLLLGLHNRMPASRILDAACALRDRGRVRHIALSGHRRALFPELIDDPRLDVWHVRYNAVHRKAEQEVLPALAHRAVGDRPGLVSYTATRFGDLLDARRTPPGEPTPTAVDCYRFVLSHPAVDVVLSGPADVGQMREALSALEQGPLDEAGLAWMRRVGDHIYAHR